MKLEIVEISKLTESLLNVIENYLHTDEKMNSSELLDELFREVQNFMEEDKL
jgi:hypothetical protein